jgi:hypothetical protein
MMNLQAYPGYSEPTTTQTRTMRLGRDGFALALAGLMAVLLLLVPVLESATKFLFLLTLVPLALWAAAADTEKAIYVYFAWCWMDGTIRGLFDDNAVSIVARDLVMFAILFGWGVRRLQTRNQDPIRVPPGTLLVVLFVIDCLLQVANPDSLGLIADLGGFKMHFAFLPLLFIGYDVFRRREQVRPLLLFLTLATLIVGAVSVVQYQHGPAWTYAHFPGSQKVISQNLNDVNAASNSQVGTFKPPGTTTFGGGAGGFIGIILPLTFALVLLSKSRRFSPAQRLTLGVGIFVFIVMIFLNSVRSGLVDAAVGSVFCGIFAGGKIAGRAALVGVFCLFIGVMGFNYANTTSKGAATNRFATTFADPNKALHADRQTFFDQFGYIISQAPLGVGIGRVGAAKQINSGADSRQNFIFSEAYLGSMIAETGIPGALLIFCIAVFYLYRGFVHLQALRNEDDKLLAAGLMAVLGVIFVNFFFTPILLSLPAAPLFWLFSAILLRVYRPIPATPALTRRTA